MNIVKAERERGKAKQERRGGAGEGDGGRRGGKGLVGGVAATDARKGAAARIAIRSHKNNAKEPVRRGVRKGAMLEKARRRESLSAHINRFKNFAHGAVFIPHLQSDDFLAGVIIRTRINMGVAPVQIE